MVAAAKMMIKVPNNQNRINLSIFSLSIAISLMNFEGHFPINRNEINHSTR
jgi:hypothetical protein